MATDKPPSSAPRTTTPPATGAAAAGVPAHSTGADISPRADSRNVTDFIARMKSLAPVGGTARGRLVFAMDATMSRQPTWDMALGLQAQMFDCVKAVGGLDVQLVYFRGAGECRSSKWVSDPAALARLMTQVDCRGGFTQLGRVLSHARSETEARRIAALVYVGDCMEEPIDDVCGRAGELSLHGVPVFLFQEGNDATAERAFKEIARLTRGAHCRFDAGSAAQLKALLTAVAVYAAGGRQALERLAGEARGQTAKLLLGQMK
jgi:hypothetical protein